MATLILDDGSTYVTFEPVMCAADVADAEFLSLDVLLESWDEEP